MRIRHTIVTIALVGMATAVSPAPAAVAADTNLGSAGPGASVTSQLGAVTVTDDRAALNATWTATVSATSFTTGGATATETIANSALSYWSGPATATTGTGTATPGQP